MTAGKNGDEAQAQRLGLAADDPAEVLEKITRQADHVVEGICPLDCAGVAFERRGAPRLRCLHRLCCRPDTTLA
ncbi:MAG TPA: hypothetical protein VNC60_03210 [Actinomycetota bacterium]|nr:hypothetical protein [Actinomycetota bacterium]